MKNAVEAQVSPRRLTALDGLRGLAAVSVVFCHVVDADPAFVDPRHGSLSWWLSYLPVNILWSGGEAVIIFFVLSGFVLSRPFIKGGERAWQSYYPRRLIRLYLPIWGALLATLLLTLVASRHVIAGATAFTNAETNGNARYIAQDALLPHIGDTFDGPLWSLHWEILFSISLPVYVILARSFKRSLAVRIAVILVMLALAAANARVESTAISNAIVYMPVFGIGVLIAFYERELVTAARRVLGSSIWARSGLVVATFLLADASTEFSESDLPGWATSLLHGTEIFGAAMVILIVLSWPSVARKLDTPWLAWVGKRSFSLYLIHEPILISLVLWMGGRPNVLLLLAVTAPVTIGATAAFYALVERPSHRLANCVGHVIDLRALPTAATVDMTDRAVVDIRDAAHDTGLVPDAPPVQ